VLAVTLQDAVPVQKREPAYQVLVCVDRLARELPGGSVLFCPSVFHVAVWDGSSRPDRPAAAALPALTSPSSRDRNGFRTTDGEFGGDGRMDFDRWEPIYEAILADFGYDRADDERARDELADLAEPFDLDRLDLAGETVAIAGAAPILRDELEYVREADAVFAASNAAEVLVRRDIGVDCMVTDLDKAPGAAADLTHEGTPVAVHAHGDNRGAIRGWVPEMETGWVIATTQAAPRPPVRNVGGFTDGDRAAFLAHRLGAGALSFPGWDFDDPGVGAEKRRKLRWAARLLAWLEDRRGERFPVLDGHRDALEQLPGPERE